MALVGAIAILAVGPLVGWLLGRGKGLALEGAVLGLFLNIVGWAIVAVLPARLDR